MNTDSEDQKMARQMERTNLKINSFEGHYTEETICFYTDVSSNYCVFDSIPEDFTVLDRLSDKKFFENKLYPNEISIMHNCI